MNTCGECQYMEKSQYDSGSCLRFPPIPVPNKEADGYGGYYWVTQTEYPTVWKIFLSCGEFKEKE